VADPVLLVATETFFKRWEGADQTFSRGETRIWSNHPVLKGVEHMFEPVKATRPWDAYEEATAAPDEKRGAPKVRPVAPDLKPAA